MYMLIISPHRGKERARRNQTPLPAHLLSLVMKPVLQLHLYDPLVFSQTVLLSQGLGSCLHSFTSETTKQKR